MLLIEPLSRRHDRKGFNCGDPSLNEYLQKTALQHIEKGISRTFALTDSDAPVKILGFFTLAGCEVVTRGLPAGYAGKYPENAPAAKLARLAVSIDRQRQGLGMIMMVEAMKRSLSVADNIGIIGIFVDAKNHSARVYYEQFGFIALQEDPLVLFLPLQLLKAVMEPPAATAHRAEGKGQRVEGKGQRAKGKGQRAKGKGQSVTPGFFGSF